MRSYIRHDPKTVEEKLAAGYTLAQIGALAMLHDQAEQQPERGRFKSMALLVASMDCMVEEHGPKARVSQHIPFLMDREEVVKLDAGGYYVTGWDELQEGDHSPQARMELVRGRRGRPGDPGSTGAQRQRQYRAKKAVTNHVTNPNSDASPSAPTSDGDVTADSDASPDPRTRDLDRQKQEQKAIAKAVAVVTRHNPNGADGLSTEPTDVRAYGERFIHHGRIPSAEDIEFFRRVPFEYDRLAPDVVLATIDDIAAKHLARDKPMPVAKYLAGPLGDRQAAASDAGVRPRAPASQGRGAGGLTRLSTILPGAAAG